MFAAAPLSKQTPALVVDKLTELALKQPPTAGKLDGGGGLGLAFRTTIKEIDEIPLKQQASRVATRMVVVISDTPERVVEMVAPGLDATANSITIQLVHCGSEVDQELPIPETLAASPSVIISTATIASSEKAGYNLFLSVLDQLREPDMQLILRGLPLGDLQCDAQCSVFYQKSVIDDALLFCTSSGLKSKHV
jgi:hypothetical protein